MLRERLLIWSPALFSFFLAAMVAFWQIRFPSVNPLSPGAFGLLIHIPIIVAMLCTTLDRQKREIDRLTADLKRLTEAAENQKSSE
ncbi:MAG TPA: hypothetical protein VG826_01615 [Pirellulales bacterium]|nr:hypothetical protein [Pirellulales bacterium]